MSIQSLLQVTSGATPRSWLPHLALALSLAAPSQADALNFTCGEGYLHARSITQDADIEETTPIDAGCDFTGDAVATSAGSVGYYGSTASTNSQASIDSLYSIANGSFIFEASGSAGAFTRANSALVPNSDPRFYEASFGWSVAQAQYAHYIYASIGDPVSYFYSLTAELTGSTAQLLWSVSGESGEQLFGSQTIQRSGVLDPFIQSAISITAYATADAPMSSGGSISDATASSSSSWSYRLTLTPIVAPVPLPAAAWLLLSGLAGLGFIGRRKAA